MGIFNCHPWVIIVVVNQDDEVRIIARARTLTVLRGLDGKRKGALIQFLCEAGLITIMDLSGADLSNAALNLVNLSGAILTMANLNGAELRHSNLSRVNLSYANLTKANLEGANLEGANLIEINLSETNLSGSNLHKANLSNANLTETELTPIFEEHWRWDGLRGVDLSDANLAGANLCRANLSGANLSGTNLSLATNLSKIKYDNTTTWPKEFEPAKIDVAEG